MDSWVSRLAVGVFCLLMCACRADLPQSESTKDETPGEWMFQQRAFPYDTLNKSVISRSREVALQGLSARRSLEDAWTLMGPTNVGGRITDLILHPDDVNTMYVGTSVGGVWRSQDRGMTWHPIFEETGALSIGDLAMAPSDPQILYAGTGEANASATSGAFFGNGMYRSDDGGETWSHAGLEGSDHIGRIVVDPGDPERVFAAVAGTLYGPSTMRGVYRSSNGGGSWEQVLFLTDTTACIDLVMNPLNPNTLYAAMWERVRYPFRRSYAGITSRIYRSYDGGETWTHLQNGLPFNFDVGRIGIAMAPTDTSRIYAVTTEDPITNRLSGVYRSSNSGDNWTRVDDGTIGSAFSSFGWFFGNLRVHPLDRDIVFLLGLNTLVSTDAGKSWDFHNTLSDIHVDQHAFEMHPLDHDLQVMGNDGGVYISRRTADGLEWRHVDNMPISQFYACTVDPQHPDRISGGMQDNGTSISTTEPGVWRDLFGGDGFQSIIHPNDSSTLYVEYQWGNLFKTVDAGENWWRVQDGIDQEDRNNWNTPFVMDPQDPSTLYFGTQRLYRTVDDAASWFPISDDLTDPFIS